MCRESESLDQTQAAAPSVLSPHPQNVCPEPQFPHLRDRSFNSAQAHADGESSLRDGYVEPGAWPQLAQRKGRLLESHYPFPQTQKMRRDSLGESASRSESRIRSPDSGLTPEAGSGLLLLVPGGSGGLWAPAMGSQKAEGGDDVTPSGVCPGEGCWRCGPGPG